MTVENLRGTYDVLIEVTPVIPRSEATEAEKTVDIGAGMGVFREGK